MNIAINSALWHGATGFLNSSMKDYLMINSAEIKNFRTFKNLKVSDFRRINVIVGGNGAGKTALMEALFLGTGSATGVPMAFKVWRSQISFSGAPHEVSDGIFEDLFYNFDRKQVISLTTKGTEDDSRSLRIYYDPKFPTVVPLMGGGTQNATLPIVFEWKNKKGKPVTASPVIQFVGQTPANISFPTGLPRQSDPTFLASRTPFNETENADRFDKLTKMKKTELFIEAITKHLFKEGLIASVTIGSEGGKAVLRVQPANISRPVSPSLVSDGLTKIINILLNIAYSQKTATFVDEIENGIHFSKHRILWEQMLRFCEEFGTQLFATTHSLECLSAALSAMEAQPDAFSLIHVYQENGLGKATVTSGKDAVKLVQSGLELRT